MTDRIDYGMTHAPPNNTELTLLNIFIDQQVSADLLKHKTRMCDLVKANGLIARSHGELHFLARILSMYAQTKASTKAVGIDGQLDTASLDIREGKLQGKEYVAIVSLTSKDIVLRGPTRDTKAEAMESFIDVVLVTGLKFKNKLTAQRDEFIEKVKREEIESSRPSTV